MQDSTNLNPAERTNIRLFLSEWKSKKIVTAGKITGFRKTNFADATLTALLVAGHNDQTVIIKASDEYIQKRLPNASLEEAVGGYYVLYEDGYESWSPAKAFEEGYDKI